MNAPNCLTCDVQEPDHEFRLSRVKSPRATPEALVLLTVSLVVICLVAHLVAG